MLFFPAEIRSPYLFWVYSFSYIFHSISFHMCTWLSLSTYYWWYLGWLYFHSIINGTSMNTSVQMSLWFSTKSGIFWSCESSIFNFYGPSKLISILDMLICTLPTVNQDSYVPKPLQHLLIDFLMIAILTGVRWYLHRDLICISLMAQDAVFIF